MTVFQPHDFPTIALLIGIHSSGKSTFYHQYLYESHIRICSKQLKTRYREQLLLDACLCGKVPFAVDSTNITRSIRAPLIYRYIDLSREKSRIQDRCVLFQYYGRRSI